MTRATQLIENDANRTILISEVQIQEAPEIPHDTCVPTKKNKPVLSNSEIRDETRKDESETNSAICVIVAKGVRSHLKNLPTSFHCAADAIPTINLRVIELILAASERARANGRKTVRASDF
jgi:hypothetical protein